MRAIDKNKSPSYQKAAKTINFDHIVLQRLEAKAVREETTVTKIVNNIIREVVLTDERYYRHLAKQAMLKYHEMVYLAEQSSAIVEVDNA